MQNQHGNMHMRFSLVFCLQEGHTQMQCVFQRLYSAMSGRNITEHFQPSILYRCDQTSSSTLNTRWFDGIKKNGNTNVLAYQCSFIVNHRTGEDGKMSYLHQTLKLQCLWVRLQRTLIAPCPWSSSSARAQQDCASIRQHFTHMVLILNKSITSHLDKMVTINCHPPWDISWKYKIWSFFSSQIQYLQMFKMFRHTVLVLVLQLDLL